MRIPIVILLLAGTAWADAGFPYVADGPLLAFGGKVFICLGGMILLLYLLRRRRQSKGGQGPLRTLGSVPLGGKERAVLVEVLGEKVLLGVSEGTVRLLLRLRRERHKGEPQEPVEEMALRARWPEGPLSSELEERGAWRPLPEVVKAIERNLSSLKAKKA